MVLHGYWRSTAAYRVRIALALKGIAYRQVAHDLRRGEQRDAAYQAMAPQGLVPMLAADGLRLTQSGAIIEWLDECYPSVPLLPTAPDDRATVRAMAAIIGCDIHPINNLRVLDALRADFAAGEAQVTDWIAQWTAPGLAALEILVARHGRGFSFGSAPTLADCFLIPQLYAAQRFNVDITPYPCLRAVSRNAQALPPFVTAHPDRQPDADAA